MDKPKKRIGRPTRPPKPGERVTLGLRVTAELKNRIEGAANEKGRSLSQEAEFRLERSFDREELLPEVLTLAYGKALANVFIAKRPQLAKLDATLFKRMIDHKDLRDVLAKHFDNSTDVFGEEEQPPVGDPLPRSAHRTGAKDHRAKR
jgi:hypothetical protein